MASGHGHGAGTTNTRALGVAFALTGSFLVVEAVAGIWTGSLALISDAAHMLTDTAGLAIALAGVKIGERPADTRRTFGYKRFEILATAFNAIILLGSRRLHSLRGVSKASQTRRHPVAYNDCRRRHWPCYQSHLNALVERRKRLEPQRQGRPSRSLE